VGRPCEAMDMTSVVREPDLRTAAFPTVTRRGHRARAGNRGHR